MLTETLAADRALVVVRAERIADPVALCHALVAGGIRVVEFTFTTPDVEAVVAEAVAASDSHGAIVGVGTVTDARTADAAIAAGARFLVTPGIDDGALAAAREAGVPVLAGALSPTEVMRAVSGGAAAVKIFPASLVGPRYLRDLRGPFPHVSFVPSGGIDAQTAPMWISAGALAATAGSSVVGAEAVARGEWGEITARAREFAEAVA